MKTIDGDARTVRELLDGARHSIDYYQRDYRWGTKQVEELLSDLTERFADDYDPSDDRSAVAGYGHYFLGSVIISQRDGLRYIVDGHLVAAKSRHALYGEIAQRVWDLQRLDAVAKNG